jgi:hypothetical protein
MEELVMYLLNRRITGKLKDNSFLTMEIPMNAAFAGLHFYRNYYNYSMSLISETQYFKNLAEIIDTKTKNIPANYHYIAFLINNVQDEYYKNLLTSDYIKYFTELLSSEDFDKEKLSQLQLLYHFYVCKESLFSAKAKKAGPSLSYIYNYYNPKTIPDSVRYAIASHFVAFRKFDYAKKMIEPLVFRETPYSDAYVLYLHLHYTGQIPLNNTEYFEEIMKASDFLSEKEWCGLFLEKCRITFQLMDYEPLRNLFCIKCMKDK